MSDIFDIPTDEDEDDDDHLLSSPSDKNFSIKDSKFESPKKVNFISYRGGSLSPFFKQRNFKILEKMQQGKKVIGDIIKR
jgi:hypothetical protein